MLHEALHAVVIERHAAGFHLVFSHLVLNVELFLAFNLLAVETLDDVDRVDDVFDALALGFQVVAHLAAPAFQPSRLADGNPKVNRHDGQSHQPDIDIGREHQNQSQKCAREQRQQVDEEVLYRAR